MADEVYITVNEENFRALCLFLHNELRSPVMLFFAEDDRINAGSFFIYCGFIDYIDKKWIILKSPVSPGTCRFPSLVKDIFSAHLFEKEILEMFGLAAEGNPDSRRLRLHDEVWPDGYYPLRKDFVPPVDEQGTGKINYNFHHVQGEGIFEVPVGPVHAGIIGPGHFRFSAAGEPIINLELRLGYTHRGVEKLFESKNMDAALKLSECVSGDSVFGHSWAFCSAVEKISGIAVPVDGLKLRAVFLELERMYNHSADIGGIALDVGFSFVSAETSIIKESILSLNEKLTGSRYLKNTNKIGGIAIEWNNSKKEILLQSLMEIEKDFKEAQSIILSSVSFMDRAEGTGILRTKTAEDFGVIGLAGRASGILMDFRSFFPDIYGNKEFCQAGNTKGDVLARISIRFHEFSQSLELIRSLAGAIKSDSRLCAESIKIKKGFGLGYIEAWRGPVLYWIKLNASGKIERCKVIDPSFHNWQGLSYAVLGNIIPDFPVCNKSFNLSYSGNDL